jgi:hypothetical protein
MPAATHQAWFSESFLTTAEAGFFFVCNLYEISAIHVSKIYTVMASGGGITFENNQQLEQSLARSEAGLREIQITVRSCQNTG